MCGITNENNTQTANMSESKQTIQQRKEQLEAELAQLQNNLESSFGELKGDVRKHFNPRYIIKEYPKTSLGIASLLGFLLAGKKKRKYQLNNSDRQRENKNATEPEVVYREPGFTSLMFMELKRALMHKGTALVVRYLEDVVEQKMGKRDKQKDE